MRGPNGGNLEVKLDEEDASRRVPSDAEVLELARLALQVEAQYRTPQDIEWASSPWVGGSERPQVGRYAHCMVPVVR